MSQTVPFHLRQRYENLDAFGLEDKVPNMLKSKLQHMFESSTWFPPKPLYDSQMGWEATTHLEFPICKIRS